MLFFMTFDNVPESCFKELWSLYFLVCRIFFIAHVVTSYFFLKHIFYSSFCAMQLRSTKLQPQVWLVREWSFVMLMFLCYNFWCSTINNKILGLNTKSLENTHNAKHDDSTEFILFSKSSIIYGTHLTKSAWKVRGKCVEIVSYIVHPILLT